MIKILHALNTVTGNYGFSLILFACLIKLFLWTTHRAQYRSMKDMQRLQPEMERLKKLHADDPQKQQAAMMELYKSHNVNPLGGCGPMLLQMPILFAIWRAIMGEPELFSSAYFLWIHPGPVQSMFPDLFASSLADRDLPLMLFYLLTMYLSQSLNPSPSADASQKMIGTYMTLIFGYMIWSSKWPCALVLYWSVFQFLCMLQQGWVNREKTPPITPVVAKPADAVAAGI